MWKQNGKLKLDLHIYKCTQSSHANLQILSALPNSTLVLNYVVCCIALIFIVSHTQLLVSFLAVIFRLIALQRFIVNQVLIQTIESKFA